MEIKVRPLFRILGIMLCGLNLVVIVSLILGTYELEADELRFFILSSGVFSPLVFSSAILGKVPGCLVQYLDEESIKDFNETEKLFTRFNSKSVGFAIVFISMAAYSVYINM